MHTINYRPALHHPIYKGGYYFILFWAILDLSMTLRHFVLYGGATPIFFHFFVVLAIALPFFKRSITLEVSTKKVTYQSNILGETRLIMFEKPIVNLMIDRKMATVIIETEQGKFDTKITEDYEELKFRIFILVKIISSQTEN